MVYHFSHHRWARPYKREQLDIVKENVYTSTVRLEDTGEICVGTRVWGGGGGVKHLILKAVFFLVELSKSTCNRI